MYHFKTIRKTEILLAMLRFHEGSYVEWWQGTREDHTNFRYGKTVGVIEASITKSLIPKLVKEGKLVQKNDSWNKKTWALAEKPTLPLIQLSEEILKSEIEKDNRTAAAKAPAVKPSFQSLFEEFIRNAKIRCEESDIPTIDKVADFGKLVFSHIEVDSYLLVKDKRGYGNICLVRVPQADGTDLWAIRSNQSCFNKQGFFEFEPIPSSRTAEFFAECRYKSVEEALQYWNQRKTDQDNV